MAKFNFDQNPKGPERLSADTRDKIYGSLEKILATFGEDEDQVVGAYIPLSDPTFTEAPREGIPILSVSKPKPRFAPFHTCGYQVDYTFKDPDKSLYVGFPQEVRETAPFVEGTHDGAPYNAELSESDALRLLFDLEMVNRASVI
jgi:hypothetical protein